MISTSQSRVLGRGLVAALDRSSRNQQSTSTSKLTIELTLDGDCTDFRATWLLNQLRQAMDPKILAADLAEPTPPPAPALPAPPQPVFISITEATAILGVSRWTVQRAIHDNRIMYRTICRGKNNRYLVDVSTYRPATRPTRQTRRGMARPHAKTVGA